MSEKPTQQQNTYAAGRLHVVKVAQSSVITYSLG